MLVQDLLSGKEILIDKRELEVELDPRYVNVSGDRMTAPLYDFLLNDTKANILSSTPSARNVGFSTDTFELFVADGTSWRKVPFAFVSDTSSPDMGWKQNSSRIGYGEDYITDKRLSNACIGNNNGSTDGCIRFNSATSRFQVYRTGSWRDIVTGLVLREDSTFGYTFEHQPTGFSNYVEIMTGQSLSALGLNGLPIINAYKISMGAYPVPATIGGRTI